MRKVEPTHLRRTFPADMDLAMERSLEPTDDNDEDDADTEAEDADGDKDDADADEHEHGGQA